MSIRKIISDWWVPALLTLAIVALAALMIVASIARSEDCKRREGRMVPDGTYTFIAQTMGSMTVIVPHPNYACSVDLKR